MGREQRERALMTRFFSFLSVRAGMLDLGQSAPVSLSRQLQGDGILVSLLRLAQKVQPWHHHHSHRIAAPPWVLKEQCQLNDPRAVTELHYYCAP